MINGGKSLGLCVAAARKNDIDYSDRFDFSKVPRYDLAGLIKVGIFSRNFRLECAPDSKK